MQEPLDSHDSEAPLVSVVMPVLNEEAHLEKALEAIDAQAYPAHRIEVLIVDGGSTDTTWTIAQRRSMADSRVVVLGAAGVSTPLAMNLGIERAKGEFIAKIDGHGFVNADYLSTAVQVMQSDNAIGCVGGRIVPEAIGVTEESIALARFSNLGVGGGIYTLSQGAKFTPTVQCGVYRADALRSVRGFDVRMAYGEDEEVNYRLRLAGWRIRFDPRMQFTYRVRRNHRALFRQYFRYGRARVAVVRKHPAFFQLKHAAPAAALVSLCGALLFGMAKPAIRIVWMVPLAYGSTVLVGAGTLSARHRFRRPDLVAAAIIALHMGYGMGSLRGLYDLGKSAIESSVES